MKQLPNIHKVIYELEMWGLGSLVQQVIADSFSQSMEFGFQAPIAQRVERRLRHLRQRYPIFKISRKDNFKLVISPINQVVG
jgi:hypothetical protein